jgi:uncharacterized protein (TIGR02284 family)
MTNTRLDAIARMLVDSQKGYEDSAQIAKDPAVARMFAERARRRMALKREFAGILPSLDATDREGSIAGGAHRAFIELRRLVQDDTRVALSEVERGETAFLEALDEALADRDLTAAERSAVARLHEEVRTDRDAFAALNPA